MGGLFGGGKKKSSDSSSTKSTTAESIETADGTVYDRRGTTPPAAPATSPVASMTTTQPESMGATTMAAPQQMQRPAMEPMETVLPSAKSAPGLRGRRRMGTLAGQAGYGFG
jgi:hypothetical protein